MADLDSKHTIIDLSCPKGLSVNDGACRDTYLGTKFQLYHPSIDDIVYQLYTLYHKNILKWISAGPFATFATTLDIMTYWACTTIISSILIMSNGVQIRAFFFSETP